MDGAISTNPVHNFDFALFRLFFFVHQAVKVGDMFHGKRKVALIKTKHSPSFKTSSQSNERTNLSLHDKLIRVPNQTNANDHHPSYSVPTAFQTFPILVPFPLPMSQGQCQIPIPIPIPIPMLVSRPIPYYIIPRPKYKRYKSVTAFGSKTAAHPFPQFAIFYCNIFYCNTGILWQAALSMSPFFVVVVPFCLGCDFK